MSVLFTFENCALISHESYVNQIYRSTLSNNSYTIKEDLFNLNVPYNDETISANRTSKRRKKSKPDDSIETEYDKKEFELVITFLNSQLKKTLIFFNNIFN